jgi:membrane-bound lytic murein transglycosylase A
VKGKATTSSGASLRLCRSSATAAFGHGDGRTVAAWLRGRGVVLRAGLLSLALLASGPLPGARAADTPSPLALVPEGEVPGLLDDEPAASLREAIRQTLSWLERRPADSRLVFGPRVVTAREQVQALGRLVQFLEDDPAPEVLEARLRAEFDVLRSAGRDDGSVLVTGYHEPIVSASPSRQPGYTVPIFAVPADLPPRGTRAVPYWTRAEIEAGRLGARAPVLAWARDPIDVFFMEVEGSGTLRYPDGREVRVGHAATNGRPYRSIGRLLIDEGKIREEAMSMRALRAWLGDNPTERARVLRHNPSYVFFRPLPGSPVGSLGLPLTPGRSIATDPRVFPPGGVAFVRTERPVTLPDGALAWVPVSRLVLNQDAGGAIRGPGRVDVFWGRGPDADLAASEMKQIGELYFLVRKSPPDPPR